MPQPLCQWMTCDSAPIPNGYLCEVHLAKVLKGGTSLRTTFKDIAIGLGMGIAGNALYSVLFTSIQGIQGGGRRLVPVFDNIGEGLMSDTLKFADAMEQAISEVEAEGADIEAKVLEGFTSELRRSLNA